MPQWIIEILYPVAVFLWVITGTVLIIVLWFLHRNDIHRLLQNAICDVLMVMDRIGDWALDKLFGTKGKMKSKDDNGVAYTRIKGDCRTQYNSKRVCINRQKIPDCHLEGGTDE